MSSRQFLLADLSATRALGEALAARAHIGDLIFLSGKMGAGKTALARAMISALNRADMVVPSPTFTMVYPYETGFKPVWHADLFRLTDAAEVQELALNEARGQAIVLVEWPENGADYLDPPSYRIGLERLATGAHQATIEAPEDFLQELEHSFVRQQKLDRFLNAAGYGEAHRRLLAGDASSRRFLRLTHQQASYVLMDWEAGADGPTIYDGQSYSQRACLAEAAPRFSEMIQWLDRYDLPVPHLAAEDLASGFILLEDLGDKSLDRLAQDDPLAIIMRAEAVSLLRYLHELPAAPFLKPYNADVLGFETSLFLDWYLPAHDITLDDAARHAWQEIWQRLCADHLQLPAVTVLRDYHSPNILWREDLQSWHRVGLIDVQDALAGSPAYDLVSLLQDARIDVAVDEEQRLLARYLYMVDGAQASQFMREYHLLGLQRNLKIAGIFHRLNIRDGKPAYLRHLPRIEAYIRRGLAQPHLQPVVDWLRLYAPQIELAEAQP